VKDLLGTPLKAYGTQTFAGKTHIPSISYILEDGTKIVRVKYFVDGIRHRGIVWAEIMKPKGSLLYKYNYLFVQVPGAPKLLKLVWDGKEIDEETSTPLVLPHAPNAHLDAIDTIEQKK